MVSWKSIYSVYTEGYPYPDVPDLSTQTASYPRTLWKFRATETPNIHEGDILIPARYAEKHADAERLWIVG